MLHPKRRRLGAPATLACLVAALGAACGRTELTSGPPKPPGPACVVDADCPGYGDLCTSPVTCEHQIESVDSGAPALVAVCVAGTPVDCNDSDPCTLDTCHPDTGVCTYSHITPDQDGDGFYAPLPGFAPGAAGSCGNDCDDSNPHVYPGAAEVCDGVDNDCDGIVDNGAIYVPAGTDVRVSGPVAPADPGGMAWGGTSYAASYTGAGEQNGFSVFLSMLTPAGAVITPPGEQTFTRVDAAASGGPLVWIGDRYGMVWQDRRDGNYEVYFNTISSAGAKQQADVRLTFDAGFSVNPALAWNNVEFLVAWQDDSLGAFDVFAERVDASGTALTGNLQLTHAEGAFDNESPVLAPGLKGVGVAWSFGDSLHEIVDFQVWSPDLSTPITPALHVTDGSTQAVYPAVVWNRDRYVVAWYDETATPAAIYAAAFLEDGTLLIPPVAITDPGPFHSRYPFLKALGDRLLVVYSDDRDQNDGYEIYERTVLADLTPLSAETRVTFAPRDSVFPLAAFGHLGDFGVQFRDDREGGQQNVYFTTLTCSMPMMMGQ